MELKETKAYQDELRNRVWSKCQKQMVIAAKCKQSPVWFNVWLMGRREASPEEIKNVELFLERD